MSDRTDRPPLPRGPSERVETSVPSGERNPRVHGSLAAQAEILASPTSAARDRWLPGRMSVQAEIAALASSYTSMEPIALSSEAAQFRPSASLFSAARELRLWPPTSAVAQPGPPVASASSQNLGVESHPSRAGQLQNPTLGERSAAHRRAGARPDHDTLSHRIAEAIPESQSPPPVFIPFGQLAPSSGTSNPPNKSAVRARRTLEAGTGHQQTAEARGRFPLSSHEPVPLRRVAPSSEASRPRGDPQRVTLEAFREQIADPNATSSLHHAPASVPAVKIVSPSETGRSWGSRRPRGSNSAPTADVTPKSRAADSEIDKDPYRDALNEELALAEKTVLQEERTFFSRYPGRPVQYLLDLKIDEGKDHDEKLLQNQRKMKEVISRLEILDRQLQLLANSDRDTDVDERRSQEYCREIKNVLRTKVDPQKCRDHFRKELRRLVRHGDDPSNNYLIGQYSRVIREKAQEIADRDREIGRIAEKEETRQAADLLGSAGGRSEGGGGSSVTGGTAFKRLPTRSATNPQDEESDRQRGFAAPYDDEKRSEVLALSRLGIPIRDIHEKTGISTATISRWRRKHREASGTRSRGTSDG